MTQEGGQTQLNDVCLVDLDRKYIVLQLEQNESPNVVCVQERHIRLFNVSFIAGKNTVIAITLTTNVTTNNMGQVSVIIYSVCCVIEPL